MAVTPNPENGAPRKNDAPHWWWHDDAYVAKDKPNLLAAIEIVAALCLYGGIAYHFQTPWSLIVPVVMAPLLLLRSEVSIQRGLELLKGMSSSNSKEIRSKQAWTISITVAIIGFALTLWASVWLVQTWLTGHGGWALFWRSWIIGAVVLTGVVASSSVGLLSIGVAAGADGEPLSKFLERYGLKVILPLIFLLPGLVIGYCLYGLLIRIRATLTLKHIVAGMAAFSNNWRETVLLSNMRHAPALLPRAGSIDPYLDVSRLIKNLGDHWVEKLVSFSFAIAITLVATLYRWNIKASAFIWGPIAFGLRRNVWESHQDVKKRKRAANLTSWLTIGSVLVFWLFLAVNWAKSFRNITATTALNKTQSSFFADITDLVPVIPINSLLFCALTLLVVCLLCLFCLAFYAHNAHFPIFNNSNDWDGTKSENRAEGRKDALYVTKTLSWTLVSAYFFVCVVFFMLLAYFQTDSIKPFINTNIWNFIASPQFMQTLMK